MEIKVGNRYKRVHVQNHAGFECYIGQEVIITYVDMDTRYVWFKKKLRNGAWRGDANQSLENFNKRFKPFQMQMRNK